MGRVRDKGAEMGWFWYVRWERIQIQLLPLDFVVCSEDHLKSGDNILKLYQHRANKMPAKAAMYSQTFAQLS